MTSREQEQADEVQGEDSAREAALSDQIEDNGLGGVARVMEFVGKGVEANMEGLFNTFRIGNKWADVQPMEILDINVRDSMDDEPRRPDSNADHAVPIVMSVHVGELGDMLQMHVGLNHGVRGQAMPEDKRLELRRILRKAYGRVLDESKCVVVYIARFPV